MGKSPRKKGIEVSVFCWNMFLHLAIFLFDREIFFLSKQEEKEDFVTEI